MVLKLSLLVDGIEWLPPTEWLREFFPSIGAYSERDVVACLKSHGFRIVGSAAASSAPHVAPSVTAATPNVQVEARLTGL